jgi:predicted metalloprotease with PDZ domain
MFVKIKGSHKPYKDKRTAKRVFCFIALLLFFFNFQTEFQSKQEEKQTPKKLSYTVEPVSETYALRLRIELAFEGNSSGNTKLLLPSTWATQSRLYNGIKNLEVLSSGAKLSDTLEPQLKTITHAPNQLLRIRYNLVQDTVGPPSTTRGAAYRPILQTNYFHFLGNIWVRPDWNLNDEIAVSLEWKDYPEDWVLANSFGADEYKQSFQIPLGAFIRSVYVGGDVRFNKVLVNGNPVYVIMRGRWKFSDKDFVDVVQKVFLIEREFWNDYDYPHYLVTLIPVEDPQNGIFYGGTHMTKSFAGFATKSIRLDDLKPLLAHEIFHNWTPAKIGRIRLPEQSLYWINEGFTDYYTYVFLSRANLLSLEDYVKRQNEMIRNYYFSPVRNATNEQVQKDFFTNEAISRLPYWRGRLLAANLNAMIKRTTNGKHSLDDVMRDLYTEFKKDNQREIYAPAIAERIKHYTGQDIMPDIKRYIDDGETITPDKDALGSCVEQQIYEVPVFELGFDLDALRTKKTIEGIKPESAAHKAGLRDGQTVVKHSSIFFGDSTKRIEITIKEGSKQKTITFYPASANKMRVPQYAVKDHLSDKEYAQCVL